MPGLNMEIIKDLHFPLPPMALQQRLKGIADQSERLWAQQEEALRQAEHLFQALLRRAFAGEHGLGESMDRSNSGAQNLPGSGHRMIC